MCFWRLEEIFFFLSRDLSVFTEQVQQALHHVTIIYLKFCVKTMARCGQVLMLEAASSSVFCFISASYNSKMLLEYFDTLRTSGTGLNAGMLLVMSIFTVFNSIIVV